MPDKMLLKLHSCHHLLSLTQQLETLSIKEWNDQYLKIYSFISLKIGFLFLKTRLVQSEIST